LFSNSSISIIFLLSYYNTYIKTIRLFRSDRLVRNYLSSSTGFHRET